VPIDTASWQPDVTVCSGYKWLGGNGGVGLAVLVPELLDKTPPAPGWMGAIGPFDMQATQLPLAKGAARFTQSTMSYISIIGLSVAIGGLLALDPAKIKTHAEGLVEMLVSGLADSGWQPFRALESQGASSHIVTLNHPEAGADETLQSLREANITCSIRNGRVRVSLAHYNDATDVEAIITA